MDSRGYFHRSMASHSLSISCQTTVHTKTCALWCTIHCHMCSYTQLSSTPTVIWKPTRSHCLRSYIKFNIFILLQTGIHHFVSLILNKDSICCTLGVGRSIHMLTDHCANYYSSDCDNRHLSSNSKTTATERTIEPKSSSSFYRSTNADYYVDEHLFIFLNTNSAESIQHSPLTCSHDSTHNDSSTATGIHSEFCCFDRLCSKKLLTYVCLFQKEMHSNFRQPSMYIV